jgi:3-demethoxyubiquinol 3-hydroxylase
MTQSSHLSPLDRLIIQGDRVLRTLAHGQRAQVRLSPADPIENGELSPQERAKSAGLMRVNHAGEVCAQALYQGQALTAKLAEVRTQMEIAADEEMDHLHWCEDRLKQLQSRPSYLNPMWYGLSFGLGAAAGFVSDKLSLGFLAATEKQVSAHLKDHLIQLPENDKQSRAVIEKMLFEEETHAVNAQQAGGYVFPQSVQWAMRLTSKILTSLSYRL